MKNSLSSNENKRFYFYNIKITPYGKVIVSSDMFSVGNLLIDNCVNEVLC